MSPSAASGRAAPARNAAFRLRASAFIAGILPFGGSTTIELRFCPSTVMNVIAAGEPEVVVAADHAAARLLEKFQMRLRRRVLAADRRRRAVAGDRRIVLDLPLVLISFSIAAACSFDSTSESTPAGRSTGVIVATSYMPCRSGWPSIVRGAAAGAAGLGI